MTTSASGSVVDETGAGISGLSVELEDLSRILFVSLAKGVTNSAGQFSLSYAGDLPVSSQPGQQARQLRLRILQGQHVLKEVVQDDTAQSALTFATIQIKAAETSSWWATLGTGAPSRLTHGNAVRWLVDNEDAWGRVETVIENAKTRASDASNTTKVSLDVMQLQIEVDEYNKDITSETPLIVLRFDPERDPLYDLQHGLDRADLRIERSMLEAAQSGIDVRIQIPKMTVDRHGIVAIGAILGLGSILLLGATIWALLALVGIFAGSRLAAWFFVDRKVFSNMFGKRELETWFNLALSDPNNQLPAPAQLGTVRVGELRLRSNFVTHAKILIDRGTEAVLLGSPFEQVYFDSRHKLDDLRRGASAEKGPIHDVSVGVRGPAVGHLQEVFNSHWNIAEPSDALPVTPVLPLAPSLSGGEIGASVQVVRTLDSMFTTGTDGEKGILEAYLRAIHRAERFIYIENQYFNNDAITQALIDALNKNSKLSVLLLLNAAPDMPLYMGWQQKAIRRITSSVSGAKDRVGVFSTWTHESPETGASDTTILDNYLHTKTALIDNRWATVGSANLDGASLDFVQYARPLLEGEIRNTETNIVVFEETTPQVSAVDALRRRLWAEHLGYVNAAGEPDVTHADLADAPTKEGKDWLLLWRTRANAKRDALKQSLDHVQPCRVLEWPSTSFEESLGIWRLLKLHKSHSTALAYLQSALSLHDVPSDVIADGGPPSINFFYGASANPGKKT